MPPKGRTSRGNACAEHGRRDGQRSGWSKVSEKGPSVIETAFRDALSTKAFTETSEQSPDDQSHA
jgi:hypothetical protein